MAIRVKARRRPNRAKVSTTVAPETLAYVQALVKSGDAFNLAEALDLVVRRLQEHEARVRLEQETVAYYNSLTDEEIAEDNAWAEFAGRALFERQEKE